MTEPDLGEVAPYDGPPLVYGQFRVDMCLVVLRRDWTEQAADEVARWRAVRTWGEALEVAATMTAQYPPVDRQYFEEGVLSRFEDYEAEGEVPVFDEEAALASRFDPYKDTPGYDELNWPAFPPELTYEHMPADWDVGDWVLTTLDGEHLEIDPEDEPRLLAYAEAAGVMITRDDDLISRLMM